MHKTNVLVIGSGGREHAIVWKISKSPRVGKIFVAPGNAGTSELAENVEIQTTNFPELIKFATENKIDLTIVGPDDPLSLGIVDEFQKAGLRIFGPTKNAARVESSKAFSKDLMKKQNVPTATYKIFRDSKIAIDYLKNQKFPLVVKASGLALGKGVSICQTFREAEDAVNSIMIDKSFGDSGSEIIIEEYLGKDQEISIHCITDGKDFLLFPTAQDHKPIFDGDKGPNTGGMGTYAPIPWAGKEYLDWASKNVIKPILKGLKEYGSNFTGCLYPGLKLTNEGLKVLEFNARFGDPETQSYMMLLDTDLLDIIDACLDGTLSQLKVNWKSEFAVCVILASEGYPVNRGKDVPIKGIKEAEKVHGAVVFHSGTKKDDGQIFASGGRVLGVSATGKTLREAVNIAYKAITKIEFDGMQYRKDIAAKALSRDQV